MSLRFKNRHRQKPKGNPSGNAQQRRKAKRVNLKEFNKAAREAENNG